MQSMPYGLGRTQHDGENWGWSCLNAASIFAEMYENIHFLKLS